MYKRFIYQGFLPGTTKLWLSINFLEPTVITGNQSSLVPSFVNPRVIDIFWQRIKKPMNEQSRCWSRDSKRFKRVVGEERYFRWINWPVQRNVRDAHISTFDRSAPHEKEALFSVPVKATRSRILHYACSKRKLSEPLAILFFFFFFFFFLSPIVGRLQIDSRLTIDSRQASRESSWQSTD